MSERLVNKRTVVGVPFYDGEGREVLESCLKNIDDCLNNLGVDAKIVVGINGPRVSHKQTPLSYQVDRSKYNADIKFIKTPPGLVNAEKAIGRRALEEGYERIFLTDADISRFPFSLSHLWENGDRPVVGANYSTYPSEILIGSGIVLTPREITFMRIFEADKHPLAREFTFPYRPEKRLKGSLLLVDTNIIRAMFGYQSITSDSRMNRLVPDSDRQLISNAAFMHFARVDITDHIQARLRHFRAAEAVNDLELFSRKSLMYETSTANEIARRILEKHPKATEAASDFLLQCALRHQVVEICKTIASKKKYEPQFHSVPFDEVEITPVSSFEEASERITDYLGQVNWDNLNSPVTDGSGTTNRGQTRVPIDMQPFLESDDYRHIILKHLGLDKNTKI